jgi:uncharacterized coiled-coil DUF342 family protein
MGAAYDLMCENEGLESTIRSLRTKNRNLKKEIVELANRMKFWADNKEVHEEMNKLIAKYKTKKKKK